MNPGEFVVIDRDCSGCARVFFRRDGTWNYAVRPHRYLIKDTPLFIVSYVHSARKLLNEDPISFDHIEPLFVITPDWIGWVNTRNVKKVEG